MAKTSSIVKHAKSLKLIEKYRELRKQLKETIRNPRTSHDDRIEAQKKLARIPRRALPVQFRTRCALTGRSRGNYRDFKLSRLKFRELAHKGALPGVSKASW